MHLWSCFALISSITVTFVTAGTLSANAQDSHAASFDEGKKLIQVSDTKKFHVSGDVACLFGRVNDFKKNTDGSLDYSRQERKWRASLSYSLRVYLYKDLSFNTTLFYHLNRNINAPWINADFHYSIGRFSYRPGTFNYGYFNAELNKYDDDGSVLLEKLSRGLFFLEYNAKLPEVLQKKLRLDSTSNTSIVYAIRYGARYQNEKGETVGSLWDGKPLVSVSINHTFYRGLYAQAGIIYYPISSRRLSWEPDFTYGFGYANWLPFSFNVTYSNMTNNRFPWSKSEAVHGNFLEGIFRISFTYKL